VKLFGINKNIIQSYFYPSYSEEMVWCMCVCVCVCVEWFTLARDGGKWWVVVNTVMNLHILECAGNFLTSWDTFSFSFSLNLASKYLLRSTNHSASLIQGDSGGICTTLGNDSMSDSKQKSSHEHGSDFEQLRSYGHFLIPVHALMWTALMELADGWWLTLCIASINFASWLAHPVQFPYLDT